MNTVTSVQNLMTFYGEELEVWERLAMHFILLSYHNFCFVFPLGIFSESLLDSSSHFPLVLK